jgi:transcriptional regulator with XRE-family HTH domain
MYYPQIKQLRLQAQFKQEYVAYILNISQPQYSKLENGVRQPSTFELSRLTELYHCSTDHILTREPSIDYTIRQRKKNLEDMERTMQRMLEEHERIAQRLAERTQYSEELMQRLASLLEKGIHTRGAE